MFHVMSVMSPVYFLGCCVYLWKTISSFLDNSPKKEIHLLKRSEFSKEAVLILSWPVEGGRIVSSVMVLALFLK